MKLSPTKIVIAIVFVIVFIGALVYGGINIANKYFPKDPASTAEAQPAIKPTAIPQTGQQPTAVPTAEKPVEPTEAVGVVTEVAPIVIPSSSPDEEKLCEGKTIRVHFDAYAGFYQLIVLDQIRHSDKYCLVLVPAWTGPEWDINGYDEPTRAKMLRDGEFDIYLATNGVVSLFNSGRLIAASDQSAGADRVVAYLLSIVDGSPINSFNDLKGKKWGIVTGSAGHFQSLSTIQTFGSPSDIQFVYFGSASQAIAALNNREIDIVASWDPAIRDAIHEGETRIIVSTSWWRNITDYILVSPNADDNKSASVEAFLKDYLLAVKYFDEANLPETAQIIANWQWNDMPMNEWTGVSKDNAYGDLKSLTDNVAFARIADQYQIFSTNPDGSNYILDQLNLSRTVWEWGGVQGEPFDPKAMLQPKYVMSLVNDPTLNFTGTFFNEFRAEVITSPESSDQDVLNDLPTVLELPYKEFKFVPDEFNLIEGEREKLIQTGAAMASMVKASDVTILVTGCSAWPTGGTYSQQALINFGYGRAKTIQGILSKDLGIPITRIIIQGCAPEGPQTPQEQIAWRIVRIEVKRSGSGR